MCVRALTAAVLGLGLLACGDPPDAVEPADEVFDPSTLPPVSECAGYDCLPCAEGRLCAEGAAETLDGTCCAAGDSLVHIGRGNGAEVVDIESDGEHAFLCGGFGLRINDVRDPEAPKFVGSVTERCQHTALGPKLGDTRVFYVTHHGDSWVETPYLKTFSIDESGAVVELDSKTESGALYEGGAYSAGYLYVAAHGAGVRIYETDAAGEPTYVATLAGFGNAWKVEVAAEVAYVVDNDGGIGIVDLSDPAAPEIVKTVATSGAPKDVAIGGDRLYAALGGLGVDVFEITDDGLDLRPVATIASMGSAQSVSVGDDVLAVAAWSQVEVYDLETLLLTGTERLRPYPNFEQDLAVSVEGDVVFVGEWEGLHVLRYRNGYVAPDIRLTDRMFQFAFDEADARAVVVSNVGRLPLHVSDIRVDLNHETFTASPTELGIAAGGKDFFEVVYQPPAPIDAITGLVLETNDPDGLDREHRVGLVAEDSAILDVGDRLTDSFGFLDPDGAGQVEGLEGNVVILVYFALF